MSGVSIRCGAVTFQQWIDQLIAERFETKTALAKAMGIELTPFSRGVEAGTFNVANLLKLAAATDTPASKVLRLAGKEKFAELIEAAYGSDSASLTASQRDVLSLWDRVKDRKDRDAILVVLRLAAGESRPGERDEPPPSPRGTRGRRELAKRRGPDRRGESNDE